MVPLDRPWRRPSRIRRPHLAQLTWLFCAAIWLVLAVIPVVGGLVTMGQNPLAGHALLAGGAALLVAAEWTRRGTRQEGRGLTVIVRPDELTFERSGELVGRVRRPKAGVVVLTLQPGRGGGLTDITVWAPEGSLVGRWDPSWLGKGVLGAYRVLGWHGWPRAIADSGNGKMRWISNDAPVWMGPKRGLHAYLHPVPIEFDPAQIDWAAFARELDVQPSSLPPLAGATAGSRSVELAAGQPGSSIAIAIDVPAPWCVLTGHPEDDALELARYADALLTRVPGIYPSRESLVEGLSMSARVVGSTSLLALRVEEDIRFGMVRTSFLVTLTDRVLPRSLDSRVTALARKLTTGGAAQYRPHVESFDGALGRWQRTHTVRHDHDPSGRAPLQVVLRHQISLDDRPFSVGVEATTAYLTAAPALLAEVDAVVASMTLV